MESTAHRAGDAHQIAGFAVLDRSDAERQGRGNAMAPSQTIDVTALLDRRKLNAFNAKLMLLSFFVVLFDGYDITVMAFAAPALAKAWGITDPAAFKWVLSASLVGILFGAPIFGYVGDRFGRKIALVLSCLTFGVFTWAAVLAQNLEHLLVLRLLGGIGIGGLFPNIVALNAEFAPKRLQATAVIVTFTGVAFGGAFPGPVAAFLVPSHGWQILFHLGGIVPLVVAIIVALWMPESIRFLVLKGARQAEAARLVRLLAPDTQVGADTAFTVREEKRYGALSPGHLFEGRLAVMTPLLWFLFAVNLMVYFFLVSWMPILLASSNVPLERAALAGMLLQLGGVTGGLVIARPMDRFGMAPITVLCMLAIAMVGAIGYLALQSPALLFASVFLAGFCVLGVQFGINAVSATLYPTALRSTGSGWAFGVGRVGSIAGPVVGGLLIAAHLGLPHLYLVAAIPFVFASIAAFALTRLYARPTV
jgi:AAHS family 4-hydroxybenzoate transporter-like MFS transporter